jgi:hypothetical protein
MPRRGAGRAHHRAARPAAPAAPRWARCAGRGPTVPPPGPRGAAGAMRPGGCPGRGYRAPRGVRGAWRAPPANIHAAGAPDGGAHPRTPAPPPRRTGAQGVWRAARPVRWRRLGGFVGGSALGFLLPQPPVACLGVRRVQLTTHPQRSTVLGRRLRLEARGQRGRAARASARRGTHSAPAGAAQAPGGTGARRGGPACGGRRWRERHRRRRGRGRR